MQGDSQPPFLGRLRLGPPLAVALYALLFSSAALTLWVNQVPGRWPQELARLSPWVFLAFVGLFALYRLTLVRARKYPAFKAFFQIAVALMLFVILLPSSRQDERASGGELSALLRDKDARVRALAAEVVGYRGEEQYASLLVERLGDGSAEVRRRAHASLVKLAGQDLGGPEDAQAVKAWQERYP